MLSNTVDDFYLSSVNQQVEDEFFSYMLSVFDITTLKDTTKIDFLSLRIYKTNLGTSVDQTYHIYKNIISGYFDPGHSPKITNTPIRATSTYERDLANDVPLSPIELEQYEKRYRGTYNVIIGKLLHVQQWTRPDLNYAISRLTVFLKAPTASSFEALHHLLEYLIQHIHEPIFYPSRKLPSEEIITYHWSPHQSTSYSTFGLLVLYSDSAFASILPHRHSMQSNITTLNGVAIDWACNIQSKVAADSTNVEITTLYSTCCKAIVLHHFLTSGFFHTNVMKPIIIFADNEAAIGLLKSNKLTYRSCHEDVPIAFCYENYLLGYYKFHNISSKLNAADTFTKSTTGPIMQLHWKIRLWF